MITTKSDRKRESRTRALRNSVPKRVRLRCWWCKSRFNVESIVSHRELVHADLLAAERKRTEQIQRRLELDRQNVHSLTDLARVRGQFKPA